MADYRPAPLKPLYYNDLGMLSHGAGLVYPRRRRRVSTIAASMRVSFKQKLPARAC
jgi:hypothetical protein